MRRTGLRGGPSANRTEDVLWAASAPRSTSVVGRPLAISSTGSSSMRIVRMRGSSTSSTRIPQVLPVMSAEGVAQVRGRVCDTSCANRTHVAAFRARRAARPD